MHKLKPITPLGADSARVDQIGTISITEVVDQALASVAVRNGQQETVQKALPMTLPEVGKSASAEGVTALWTGPEQWMFVADHGQHKMLASELKQRLGGAASVVEQTDGWCRFDVTDAGDGRGIGALFERLTNIPVRQMRPGDVVRGMVEHLGVFLWRTTQGQVAVLGPRSSAASLHHALITAAGSIA